MYPLPRIISGFPPPFRRRAKLLALFAICAAGLPGPLPAQWSTGSGGTIYYNGGNVGIGTASPAASLDVAGSLNSSNYLFPNLTAFAGTVGFNGSNGPNILFGGSATFIPGLLLFQTAGTPRMTINSSGNVGIGTTTPQHLLHVAGTIGAEEVIVSSTGADYVFHRGYRLMPLSEVARYIDENHHLPDIPSAEEVKQKGMSVGEMQTKLLAKIEELTLHVIQEDERNDRLERQNQEFQRRIDRLEASGAVPSHVK